VAGHVCLDVIPDLGRLSGVDLAGELRPGRLLEIGAAAVSPGGAVANTGLALHRLGVPARLVSKVGRDPFGRMVRELVSAHGASLAQGVVEDAAVSTSYSIVLSPPGADRMFLHHPGANDAFRVRDVDFGEVERAALFHFGYPPLMRRMYERGGCELVELLRRAKQAGATTSLDTSYPDPSSPGGRVAWRPILEAALPHVDVFLPSVEELLLMLHPGRFEELSAHGPAASGVTAAVLHDLGDELLGLGVRVLALKLGERGLYPRTASAAALRDLGRATPPELERWGSRELWAPCFRVPVAGTAGAGDATIAGFHAALLRGLGPEQALTAAVAVGACDVEAADTLSGVRSWAETWKRIGAGWPRLPLVVDDPAWRWVERDEVWERRAS
jgi:sugar/nucleoside kinase (ribokinase family)